MVAGSEIDSFDGDERDDIDVMMKNTDMGFGSTIFGSQSFNATFKKQHKVNNEIEFDAIIQLKEKQEFKGFK
jgi:hypothetical protein